MVTVSVEKVNILCLSSQGMVDGVAINSDE